MRPLTIGLALVFAVLTAGCAHTSADDPADPLEPVNRAVFKFNRVADRYALRPVARTYRSYVPGEIRNGIYNVIDNLFYPTVIINDVLQGKFAQGGKDLGRFLVNSTLGIVGIMDVATPLGLPRNDEDFGQTLGRWGVGEGWYLMLPLLGPSSNRDLVGSVGDSFTSPTPMFDAADAYTVSDYHVPSSIDYSLTGFAALDARSKLLDADRLLDEQLDPYVFLRTAYLQRRYSLVFDGNPPREKFVFDE